MRRPELHAVADRLHPDRRHAVPARAARRSTPGIAAQGASPIDSGQRLGAWDAGVIPYLIAPRLYGRGAAAHRRPAWPCGRASSAADFRRSARPRAAISTSRGMPSPIARRRVSARSASRGAARSSAPTSDRTVRPRGRTVAHELGHALGLSPRASARRPRRLPDDRSVERAATTRVGNFTSVGHCRWSAPYDFGSIMHYTQQRVCHRPVAADDRFRMPPYAADGRRRWGRCLEPCETDHDAVALLYDAQLRESTIRDADRVGAHAVRSRGSAARDGAAARVLHEPLRPAAPAGARRSTGGPIFSASRSGSSTSIWPRGPAASAPKARSTSSSPRSRSSDEWRHEEPGTRRRSRRRRSAR